MVESSGAGARGWGTSIVVTNIGNAAVNNVASSREAYWGTKARGQQGLGGGWCTMLITLGGVVEDMLGRGHVLLSFGDSVN